MKRSFACSLICRNGILGGIVSFSDCAIIYKTNKLTVDKRYWNLVLPSEEIRKLSWSRAGFPIATLHMSDGQQHRLLLFRKDRFVKAYNDLKNA